MDRWKKWLALFSITTLVVLTLLGGIVSAMAGEGEAAPGGEQPAVEKTESVETEAPAVEPAEQAVEEASGEEPAEEAPAEEAPAAEGETLAPTTSSPALDGQCCMKGKICGTKYVIDEQGGQVPMDGVKILLNGGQQSTFTANGGKYCFENLALGTYTVSEEVPAGYVPVEPPDGSHEGIVLTVCKPNKCGVDFINELCCKGRITGYKFLDANKNSLMDEGEEGMAGVTILLNDGEDSVVTPASGYFEFTDLDADTYKVSEEVPAGYFATTPESYDIELECGETATAFFGNAPEEVLPGSISGTKWNDLDGDGELVGGEPPLQGVTIELWKDGAKVDETTTDENGEYSFTGLAPGDYTVKEIVPAGMTATSPESVIVTVAEGQDVTDVDFLNHEPECKDGVIEALVKVDENCNGVIDGEDTLLDGVTVELYHIEKDNSLTPVVPPSQLTGPGWGIEVFLYYWWIDVYYPGGHVIWDDLPRSYDGEPFAWYLLRMIPPDGYTVIGPTEYELPLRDCPLPCWWYRREFLLGRTFHINGYKYEDTNCNGVIDESDPGVPGVEIKLFVYDEGSSEYVFHSSTVTGVDGYYEFTGLDDGVYKVQEALTPEQLEEWYIVSPEGGIYEGLEVGCGDSYDDLDFLNARYLSIEGNKWEDLNCTGEHDEGEPPVEGITIELLQEDVVIDTTTTAADGSYSFTGLLPGTYTVREVLPEGWYPKNPDDGAYEDIVLVCGQPIEGLDFVNARYGSICGIKFLDENENGIMDEGEEGMDGVLILLDGGEDSAVTADGGKFCFEDLLPGTYEVSVDESSAPGYYPTTPNPIEVELGCGEKKEVFFGNAPYGSISGTKWLDADIDGIWDAEETVVIEGIPIKLYEGDPPGALKAETTTDENGEYSFTDLKPGTYTVVEEGGDAYFSVTADSVVVNLSGGEGAVVDFGNCPYGRVEGLKFEDLDGDGDQDTGEPGLEGVTVTLSGEGAMAKTTTTGEDGTFVFNNLLPGDYTVAETVPSGYYATRLTSVPVFVEPAESVSVIFANALYGSISGTKWIDANGNGPGRGYHHRRENHRGGRYLQLHPAGGRRLHRLRGNTRAPGAPANDRHFRCQRSRGARSRGRGDRGGLLQLHHRGWGRGGHSAFRRCSSLHGSGTAAAAHRGGRAHAARACDPGDGIPSQAAGIG